MQAHFELKGVLVRFVAIGLILLVNLAIARTACAQQDDQFVDESGTVRPFRQTYQATFEDKDPKWLRAGVEMGILVGLGTIYYWSDPLANEADWDDPGLVAKLTFDAVTFDNNLTSTNHLLHPGAGSAFFAFSRINGLSIYAALGYSAASSVIWEYFFEWREQVSINDMIFTPLGGLSLGEFFYRLGDYSNSAASGAGFGNQVARFSIGLPEQLHLWVDGAPRPHQAHVKDSLGFSSAYVHRFTVGLFGGVFENDERTSGLMWGGKLAAELVALPGHLRPGKFSLFFDEGNFTEASLAARFDRDGLAEVDLMSSATLLGHYAQAIDAWGGSAYYVGAASALRYYDAWRLGRRDHFAIVHLPGPKGSYWQKQGDLLLRARAAAHPDFAAIRPLAFNSFREQFGSAGVKSVLARRGYSFAWGGSAFLELEATRFPLSAGGQLRVGRYRSIQGLDREQASVTRDLPTVDTVVEAGGWFGVQPAPGFALKLELSELYREGSMAEFEEQRYDRTLELGLWHVF